MNFKELNFAHLEEKEAIKVAGISSMCNNSSSFKTMKPIIELR
jgi:hypothetical protein